MPLFPSLIISFLRQIFICTSSTNSLRVRSLISKHGAVEWIKSIIQKTQAYSEIFMFCKNGLQKICDLNFSASENYKSLLRCCSWHRILIITQRLFLSQYVSWRKTYLRNNISIKKEFQQPQFTVLNPKRLSNFSTAQELVDDKV